LGKESDWVDSDILRHIATLERGGIYFHYRVAGVAVDGARVLLHQTEIDDYWSLPGGHIDVGETAAGALRREMTEELNIEIEVGRLLWVIENFFDHGSAQHHEIGLYFLMDLGAGSPLYRRSAFQGDEQGIRIDFCWFPREREVLARLPVLPACLQAELTSPPEAPRHIVNGRPVASHSCR
jgi:8-oxo-dGTP pyrophosphatase MutT (NUDIX family)